MASLMGRKISGFIKEIFDKIKNAQDEKLQENRKIFFDASDVLDEFDLKVFLQEIVRLEFDGASLQQVILYLEFFKMETSKYGYKEVQDLLLFHLDSLKELVVAINKRKNVVPQSRKSNAFRLYLDEDIESGKKLEISKYFNQLCNNVETTFNMYLVICKRKLKL